MTAKHPPRPDTANHPGDRIAKVIARSGMCSRRDAERWIEAGRVRVNGTVLTSPAFNVTEQDEIAIDRKPLPAAEAPKLWRYHKPAGLITSHKDPEGRPSVFDKMPAEMPRVISVGRLDITSEGLLLLTNDGELARVLELPSTGWLRRYRVRAHGRIDQAALDKLKNGIEIDGIKYGAIEAGIERVQGGNIWITVALREGKNREVRRVLESLNLQVNRLIRTSYGPFQLGDLARGAVTQVADKMLRNQMGGRLPAAATKGPNKTLTRAPNKAKKNAHRRRKP